MQRVERIETPTGPDGCELLALVIRKPGYQAPDGACFYTESREQLQVGIVKYGPFEDIQTHIHRTYKRVVKGTPECLFVLNGSCTAKFMSEDREWSCVKDLDEGDAVLLLSGWHGFTAGKGGVKFFEVRQGPFYPKWDKVRLSEVIDGKVETTSLYPDPTSEGIIRGAIRD